MERLREHEEMRARSNIRRREHTEVVRRDANGTVRYRQEGDRGAGRLESSLARELAIRERDFHTSVEKALRRPPTAAAVSRRKDVAAARAEKVLALAKVYADRGSAAANRLIARDVRISVDHVRRIIRKSRPT